MTANAMRVLIVDPSEVGQQRIVASLPPSWHPGVICASGFLGAAWLAVAQRLDLVILDVLPPDCAGIDLLRILRRMNPNAIIAARSTNPVLEQRCRREGADHFFRPLDDMRVLHDALLGATPPSRFTS